MIPVLYSLLASDPTALDLIKNTFFKTSKTGAQVVNVTESTLDLVNSPAGEAFRNLGIAVGGLMLFFIAIYYISSLLDGGKFQIKMLLPFLIYFFVCHFTWISKPVSSFTCDITESLLDASDSLYIGSCEKWGGEGCTTFAGVWLAYQSGHLNDNALTFEEKKKKIEEDNQRRLKEESDRYKDNVKKSSSVIGPAQRALEQGEFNEDFVGPVLNGAGSVTASASSAAKSDSQILDDYTKDDNWLESTFKKIWNRINWSAFPDWRPTFFESLWMTVIALLLALVDIVADVLGLLGAVMIGIVILFGPLTFAFALFPGSGSTIKSWFIRICQFSLYAPLALALKAFSVNSLGLMLSASSVQATASAVGVGIISLVVITSVPSIASMIIEGAQGAVSLSQGLQSITSMTGVAGSILAAGKSGGAGLLHAVAGKDNSVSNFVAGVGHMGLMDSINAIRNGKAGDIVNAGAAVRGMRGNMMQGVSDRAQDVINHSNS